MMEKAAATLKARKEHEEATRQLRQSDPFESSKAFLQRRGYVVFNHSTICPNSTRVVVGSKLLERDEVIALADRFRNAR